MSRNLRAFCVAAAFLILTSTAYGDTGSTNQAQDEYINYRNSLIQYQPEFTVEGSRMITASQALQKIAASRNTLKDPGFGLVTDTFEGNLSYWVSESTVGSEGMTTFGRSEFTSGGFQWYVWHEQVPNYSRFAPTKTVLAKFPLNPDATQRSYATFSYQGFWTPFTSDADFYAMKLIDRVGGQPDHTYQIMFFYPHADYPLFFTDSSSNRYGGSTPLYYDEGVLSKILTSAPVGSSPDQLVFRRSLKSGAFLSLEGFTADQAKQGTAL